MTKPTHKKFRPLRDNVLIKQTEAENRTKGGIWIPDAAKEQPRQGEILAVGLGRFDERGERIPVEVKPGDVVIFNKYGGTPIELEGEKYLLITADAITGFVEP